MKFVRILPFLYSLCTVALAQSACDASGHNGESVQTSGNKVGKIGSIDYEIWADGGNNSATFYSDGSFSCAFNNSKDYLCRSGINISPAKTPSEIGHIRAEYKVVKQMAQNVGYSYVGVYGWTLESGISGVFEFYIVDNWLSPGRPGDWVGNEKKGDFFIDGGEYTVYKNVNGNLTQYFSLRKTERSCGTIDVTAHFEQWAKIGLREPKITEIKVLGEAGNVGGGVTGTVDFPYAKIYIGDQGGQGQGQFQPQGQNQFQPQDQNQFQPQDQNQFGQGQFQPQGQNQFGQGQNQFGQGQNQFQQGQFPYQSQNQFQDQNQNQNQGQNQYQGTMPTKSLPTNLDQYQPQGTLPPKVLPNQGQNQQQQNAAATNGDNSNCAGEWAQCGGGNDFNGPTCCQKGECVKVNDYYSQCQG